MKHESFYLNIRLPAIPSGKREILAVVRSGNHKKILPLCLTTEYIGTEMKRGECIRPLGWSVCTLYNATLYVIVNIVKGDGGAPLHPPPTPAWANFSIMMECTPESGRCHSVCLTSR
jgi:hypothetical protein